MSKRTVTGPVESGFWQENEQTYHAAIKGETDYVAIKKDTEVLDDKDEKLTLPQLRAQVATGKNPTITVEV
jgi:hypothetical protein